ncbi:hypothetical protein [Anabaena azotica]|uniref:Uncharacterized protein n=1 Tax=Anabaena azotica FACHB-119 TaxID=947527 RepID=A0ABR8DDA1_9NOST|nr:hypothetical protein [Anabaena azotica]MBD2505089.1 hypothetical protein [Anabaena azotica FACHB-119]
MSKTQMPISKPQGKFVSPSDFKDKLNSVSSKAKQAVESVEANKLSEAQAKMSELKTVWAEVAPTVYAVSESGHKNLQRSITLADNAIQKSEERTISLTYLYQTSRTSRAIARTLGDGNAYSKRSAPELCQEFTCQ